jgi:heavy metal sensor kinase
MIRRPRSVRFTLILWYSLVLLAAFALFGGSLYVYLYHLLERQLEQDLAGQVDWIHQLLAVEETYLDSGKSASQVVLESEARIVDHFRRDQRNYLVAISQPDGSPLFELGDRTAWPDLPRPRQWGRLTFWSVPHESGRSLRVAALSVRHFTIHVAFPERAIREVLDHILTIFGLLVPIVLLVSVSGGWLLAGAALQPIREITRRAEHINAENLHERIPEREVNDELGQLIRAMNRTNERLEASFREMRLFSMNVAHELRTPLTILRGEAELALGRPMTAGAQRQLATTFLEETIRMGRLVDDLLTLAKADAGQLTVDRRAVALQELITDLQDDAAVLAPSKNLQVSFERNDPAIILADKFRLRQLFRILLTNAIRYTRHGGSIVIRSIRDPENATVSLSDTGIGIPADALPHIFERFYRVEDARSRDGGGSGLGLALAKWIADSHGGSITLESTLGEGSTFTVHLPLAGTPSRPSASSS